MTMIIRPPQYLIRLLLLALLGVSLAAGGEKPVEPLARFSEKEREQLLRGEPVFSYVNKSNQSGHGQASIIINAKTDVCFDIFRRLEDQHHYFPKKTKSDVIRREGNQVLLYNEFFIYIATVEYTSWYTIDKKNHRFDFEMDKSYPHNIDESAGYFVFERIDRDRTLLRYGATKLDVGVKVPEFIKEYVTSRDLPALTINVKRRIESGGKWTKEDK